MARSRQYGTPIQQGSPCFTFETTTLHADIGVITDSATTLSVQEDVVGVLDNSGAIYRFY